MGVGSLELISCVAPAKDSTNDVSSLVKRGNDSFRRRFNSVSEEMTCTSAGSDAPALSGLLPYPLDLLHLAGCPAPSPSLSWADCYGSQSALAHESGG
jgi:hypothetical protein